MFNLKQGFKLYLLFLLLAPYIVFGSLTVRIELVLAPLLVLIFLLKRKRFIFPPFLLGMFSFWLWILLVTCFRLIEGIDATLLSTTIFGLFRLIIILFLVINLNYSRADTYELLKGFIYVSIPLSLLALSQALHSSLATNLTFQFYSSLNRTSSLGQIEVAGWLNRGVSVFETPAFAASYFLLVLTVGIYLLIQFFSALHFIERSSFFVAIALALVAGLLTLSATFVAGVIILLICLLIQLRWKEKFKFIFVGFVAIVMLSPLAFIAISMNPVASGSLVYQLNRLGSLNVFETRLNKDDGLLSLTVEAIRERPLIGWGFWGQEGVFLGDSLYVVWMYFGGMVVWCIFALLIMMLVRLCLKLERFGELVLLCLVLLLAVGLGSPSFTIPRVADWWWAMVGILVGGQRYWTRV